MNNELTFELVASGKAVPIYIDGTSRELKGLQLVAQSFAEDVRLVTDCTPDIITNNIIDSEYAILAGIIGDSELIDQLSAQEKLTSLQNKSESYVIQVIHQPFAGMKSAIVVAGSDKRGAFYGIYHLSRLIGVSPWVYWGDVLPRKQAELRLPFDQLSYVSHEPAIKYRGFFLNDEWPSLGNWTMNANGDFNEDMYKPIFELILRLNGNFMWPAMWSAVFSENGKAHPQANAELADTYGIVMGTSHHEPLFRAGEEWQHTYHNYTDNNVWDFEQNREAITSFWEDGVIRNKNYESIITLGMRGERDSALGGTLEQNINRLKDIILTQKALLKKHGLQHAPQVLVVYKEVEKFWHGSQEVAGLKHWDVLDDVTIMLSDDNFGNMRTLPEEELRDRRSGWGIYYHFDYHGGPVSYEWVNTTPLEKVWEQMTMAYDYGIRNIWIVNVGDLKPNEFPISYFMELAYRFDELGTGQYNLTKSFTEQWVKQQFGHIVDQDIVNGIAGVLTNYTKLNGTRKPEVTYPDTYSFTHYKEAESVLEQAKSLEISAEAYRQLIPVPYRDAYDQLVYFPAVASANVKKMNIYAGYNRLYREGSYPSQLANKYAALVEESILRDQQLERHYNETMSGGKWSGMMSSPHIGYVNWNADGWSYPKVSTVQAVQQSAQMIVHAEGNAQGVISGTVSLPSLHQLQPQTRKLTVSNGGNESFYYEVKSSPEWLLCRPSSGEVLIGTELEISVNWKLITESSSGSLVISGAGQTIEVTIHADAFDMNQLPQGTHIETDGIISIEAEHTEKRVAVSANEWKTLHNYGRFLSSIKVFPSTASYAQPQNAPYVEYSFYAAADADYELTVYLAPSNPLIEESRLKYAVAIDQQAPVIAEALDASFVAGESHHWEQGVLNNGHNAVTKHALSKGKHTLRFYSLDAGIVLQKLVLSRASLPYSFFGPPASYYA